MESGTNDVKAIGGGLDGTIESGQTGGPDGNNGGAPNVDAGTSNAQSGNAGQQNGGVPGGEPGNQTGGTLGDGSGVKPAAKKRGRPAGSTKSAGQIPPSLGLKNATTPKNLARSIAGFHAMAAKFTKIKLFELEPEEAKELADAVIEIGAQYNVVINPKVAAWLNLFGVASAIYGPRIALIVMMRAQSKKAAPAQSANVAPVNSNVTNIADGKIRYEG